MERQSRPPLPVQPYLPPPEGAPREGTISLADIYYVLFRHKWKILLCGLAGIIGAAAVYRFDPAPYQSEAKLFIRYVTEGKTVGAPGDDTKTISLDQRGDMIINTEVQILTSLDIADQVADAVGPEKVLAMAGGGKDRNRAAALIQHNLSVEVPLGSSVIRIVFKHPDPAIVQPVLASLIDTYLKKHLEIHAAVGIVGDFLTQETDQLRARLAQTEDELKKATDKSGVISIDEAEKEYPAQIGQIRQEIFTAEAELAERASLLKDFANRSSAPKPVSPTLPEIPADLVDQHKALAGRLDLLKRNEQDLLGQFTDESPRVKDVRSHMAEIESQKKALEEKYPQLAMNTGSRTLPSGSQIQSFDPVAASSQLSALQAKIKELNLQLNQIRAEAASVGQMDVTITDLRRRKDLEEANYRYYAASLEQARINEALGTGKVSNISQIQAPSPPGVDSSKTFKLMASLAAAGIAAGLGWAFLIEMYFDRTVRRPTDVEKNLRLPLFLSIPNLGKNGYRSMVKDHAKRRAEKASSPAASEAVGEVRNEVSSDPIVEILRPFHETLRDRLISYFESKNLTHKPKLLAVTGFGNAAGVTTTAAGLASCLSETGEGNVLLVDLTLGQGSAQQFYKGRAICGLEEILSTRGSAQIQEKLYVVAEGPGTDRLSRILPQRFSKLVPKLKASDFDYIIFDMPPVSQISVTPRLAGFMDMVLLVIESETTDLDIVKRATTLLTESKAHVGVVLNKTQTYVPLRLHQESLGNI